jgi:addiction module HigA family antidote
LNKVNPLSGRDDSGRQELKAKDNTAFVSTTNTGYASNGRTETPLMLRSLIIIKRNPYEKNKINPPHPGEILFEEFLKPLKVSQYRIAKSIGVPPRRINEIVHGQRAITADTALRLGKYFGNTPQFWMNLQTWYDLEMEKDKLKEKLDRENLPYKNAA